MSISILMDSYSPIMHDDVLDSSRLANYRLIIVPLPISCLRRVRNNRVWTCTRNADSIYGQRIIGDYQPCYANA